jgi:KDO2-lipid IV(A) lauroyltransferase
MSIAWWASKQRIKRLATFHQREYFDQALEQNKNIILLAPHFTSLELLGAILVSQTHMSSMYQTHRNPSLDTEMIRRRTRFGTNLFNYKSSMKGLVRSIRDGVPFYYLPDQDPGKTRGVFAPFFGIQTATFPALSKLSRLGDATVIPCMARVRRFGTGIDVVFDRPLENYPTSDQVADAATMNRAIEKLIVNAPEQYFWSHKRFKTRPDGEPPFY